MAKNETTVLEALGITPSVEGLEVAQTEYVKRTSTIANVLDAAKNRVETERKNIEPATDKADDILDAVMADVDNLSESELLGFVQRMESVSEFLDDVLSERIGKRLGENVSENVQTATDAYREASVLREFAENIVNILAQFGQDVSKFTKTGKTGLLLDSEKFPRLRNPEKVDASTGTRDYTTRLPVFTVEGETLPWGTTWRTLATDYIKNDAYGARDLQQELKNENVDYINNGWTHTFAGVEVSGTKYLAENEVE